MANLIDLSSNYPEERRKILDGTYPTKIIAGRQRKHIAGTVEFKQKCEQMNNNNLGSQPAILEFDADSLVKKYKGTGKISLIKGSLYPQEIIDVNFVIGKTWYKRHQKYVTTKRFKIIYSSTGVHIFPVSDYIERSE